jgi:hypothetical protein
MTDPDTTRLREFATRYTAAWCSQNAASVATFFAPIGWLKVNDNAPAVGRQAITETAQGFMTAFPDMRVLMDDIAVGGDRVSTDGRSSAQTVGRRGPGAWSASAGPRSGGSAPTV